MKGLHLVTFLLLVIGGLNWLVIGLFKVDIIAKLGASPAMIVYVLVGLSALFELFTHKKNCLLCKSSSSM